MGHKRRITALRYNSSGSILASGAQDTDIILWDIAGEIGLCRLQGAHRSSHRSGVFATLHMKASATGMSVWHEARFLWRWALNCAARCVSARRHWRGVFF